MKEKEIIKGIRKYLDSYLEEKDFKFDSKQTDYVSYNANNNLIYKISLVFVDFVAQGTNHKSKYLEIFINIYEEDVSTILWKTTARGKNLNSFFFFKIIGNMLSDIVLNPNWNDYTKRNNHNFFKLTFVTQDDLENQSKKILSLVDSDIIPFFEKFNNLLDVKNALDCCYDRCLPIHNINHERLLVLVILLLKFDDSSKNEKIQKIKKHFIETNDDESLNVLDNIARNYQPHKLS